MDGQLFVLQDQREFKKKWKRRKKEKVKKKKTV